MLLENLTKFLKYYGKKRYLKLTGFIFLSLIAGGLEFTGVALIYPFIMLIIQPETAFTFKFIKIDNTLKSGLLIGLAVLTIFILKNAFIIFSQYIQNKFVKNWKQSIINRFMQYYIYAPYKLTMNISQADKLFVIGTLCGIVIDGFCMRCMNFMTNIIIISMIILLLLIKFPIPACITIVFVCFTMVIQNKYFKSRTAAIAIKVYEKSKEYNTASLENLNNIKELKILASEKNFYENFARCAASLKNVSVKQGFYEAIPPYIVEILVVTSLLLMAFILSAQNVNDNSSLIASFAIVVAALFRIAPALNRIQSAIISINTSKKFVKNIIEEYEKCDLEHFHIIEYENMPKIFFNNKIEFKNICFSYKPERQVIKNVSFEINKGDFIGIIGLSGAGKSTLADILTGMLPVDSGEIKVDNMNLDETNFCAFRKLIGYVPQQINILDKSIKENVAWGCQNIDEQEVVKALKAAQIYDVISEYPDGINSNIIIGSNGLSQGQKQRLAIARALYRDPEIIILDEATSALDVQVENEITEMLKQVGKSKTIIAIAHRFSTLRACNKLIYMKDGQIVDIGTFEELSACYEDFANLVKLSKIN